MNNIVRAGYVVEVVAFLANQVTYMQMGFVSMSMVRRAIRVAGIGRGSADLERLLIRTGVIVSAKNGDRYIDTGVAGELVKALLNDKPLPSLDRRTAPTRVRRLYQLAKERREASSQGSEAAVPTARGSADFSSEELAALRVLRSLAHRYEDGYRVSLAEDPSDLDPKVLFLAFVPAAHHPECAAGIETLIDHGVLKRVGRCGEKRVVYGLRCDPMAIDIGPEFLRPPPRPKIVYKRHTSRPSTRYGRPLAPRRVRLAAAAS